VATIALPQIKIPKLKLPAFKAPKLDLRAVVASPYAGLAAAGALFIGVAYALITLLGPLGGESHLRLPLDAALRGAPAGWREALKPLHGQAHVYADVVRLSERPLTAQAAASARQPAAAPITGGALAAAPIAGFFAPGPGGPLPIIAQDGRTPAQAYARPFQPNGRPKVSAGDRDLAPGDHPVLRGLRRGPPGLDRHGARARP
jgi:uncharacterized protein